MKKSVKKQKGGDPTDLLILTEEDKELFAHVYVQNTFGKPPKIPEDLGVDSLPKLLHGYEYFAEEETITEGKGVAAIKYKIIKLTYDQISTTIKPSGTYERYYASLLNISDYYTKSIIAKNRTNANFQNFLIFLSDIHDVLSKQFGNENSNNSLMLIKIREILKNRCISIINIKDFFKKYILILFTILAHNKIIFKNILTKKLFDIAINIQNCDSSGLIIKTDVQGKTSEMWSKLTSAVHSETKSESTSPEESRLEKVRKTTDYVRKLFTNLEEVFEQNYISQFEFSKIVEKTKNDPNWTRVANAAKLTTLTLATSAVINTTIDYQLNPMTPTQASYLGSHFNNTFFTSIAIGNILSGIGIPVVSSLVSLAVMGIISTESYKKYEENYRTNAKVNDTIQRFLTNFNHDISQITNASVRPKACNWIADPTKYIKNFNDSKSIIDKYLENSSIYYDNYLRETIFCLEIYYSIFEYLDVDCTNDMHLPIPKVKQDIILERALIGPDAAPQGVMAHDRAPQGVMAPPVAPGGVPQGVMAPDRDPQGVMAPPVAPGGVPQGVMAPDRAPPVAPGGVPQDVMAPNVRPKTPEEVVLDKARLLAEISSPGSKSRKYKQKFSELVFYIRANLSDLHYSCNKQMLYDKSDINKFAQSFLDGTYLKTYCHEDLKGGKKSRKLRKRKTQKRRRRTHRRR